MLDTKYRPKTLKECIGHEGAVTTLRGYLRSGRPPQLLMITGDTSVGKTTLGRAFAAELNGLDANGEPNDYFEADGGQYRTKEELQSLIRSSKFLPQVGKYRVILIDEFQYVLGNAQAVPILLKEFEEPSKQTIWIICSMDPGKFSTDKNGKAILTRAVQLPLQKHTEDDLYRQGVRIVKGERTKAINPDLLRAIVRESKCEMRTLAHYIDSVIAFHAGLGLDRPLTVQDLPSILKTANEKTENLVHKYLTGLYSGSFAQAQLAILDIDDGFQFVTQCLWASKFLLNVAILQGQRHPKVWWTPANKELHSAIGKLKNKPTVGDLAAVVTMLVRVRMQVQMGDLSDLLTAATYDYLTSESK